MAPDARALAPEELLARSGWMRSLVRGIVLDDGAEDVVQDAWVAALERPGAGREPGGLAAWLAAVARNLARRRRRRAAVRVAVERAGARSERLDGPAEEVERMQLQRQLADAVLALDEPQRSAVILRHLDGCSAGEIARRQGCSVEAARQRVSRGLAQLRVHLDGELGGRANRCLVLAPWLSHSWSGALAAGGVVVGAKTVIGIAGAAALAAGIYVVASDDGTTERRGGATPVVAEAAAPERTSSAPEPEVVLADVRIQEEGSAAASTAQQREALPGKRLARGRVADTNGTPIEKAELRIAGVTVRSGADGGFDLELAPSAGGPLECHVAHEGYLPADVAVDPARFLEVRLQALPALEGLVVDEESRAVAPPGYVKAHVVAASGETLDREAELAADGSYRLSGLPPGRLASLEARARGFASSKVTPDLELLPDATSRVIVELTGGATVTGIVLDSESREPLPRAEVWLETFGPEADSVHPTTVADEHGRFRLVGAEEDFSDEEDGRFVSFWLMARAEGHVPTPVRGYGSTVSDERLYDFEVLLERATSALEIRVTLPDGRPASGAMVWAIDAQKNPTFEATDAEGRHRFEGLPAGTMVLWITELDPSRDPSVSSTASFSTTHDQSRPLHALRVELELAPGELRREELVLRAPAQVVEGRVVDTEGRPVPGVRVEASFVLQLGGIAMSSGSESTTTEADGRYLFDRLHEGKYQVSLSAGEGTTACHLPFDVTVVLVDGEERLDVDFVVGPCLVLEGRVETRDAVGLELEARDPRTDERVAGTRPEADGRFAFEPLVAGDYEVRLVRGGEVLDRVRATPALATGLVLRAP